MPSIPEMEVRVRGRKEGQKSKIIPATEKVQC